MKTLYIVRGYMAFAEPDNYENGCYGKQQYQAVSGKDWTLSADTLQGLIDSLVDEFAATKDSVILNSCDELGRLDIQVQQREAFECARPSAKTLEKFKKGEIDMFLTDYIFHVEQVNTELDLQEFLK